MSRDCIVACPTIYLDTGREKIDSVTVIVTIMLLMLLLCPWL